MEKIVNFRQQKNYYIIFKKFWKYFEKILA